MSVKMSIFAIWLSVIYDLRVRRRFIGIWRQSVYMCSCNATPAMKSAHEANNTNALKAQ